MDFPRVDAKRVRGVAGVVLLLGAVITLLWACLQPPLSLSGDLSDGALDGNSATGDSGAPAIFGLFTISGCAQLSFTNGDPQCVGTAPLQVQLILLAVGATTHRFQVTPVTGNLDGGLPLGDGGSGLDAGDAGGDGGDGGSGSLLDDPTSRENAPIVTLFNPGTYLVSLGVAGPGGSSAAAGLIIVQPASLGAACDTDAQCAAGLHCLCGSHNTQGTCPAGLSAGLCTQSCDGVPCAPGSVCLDLSRSAVPTGVDGGAASDAWRQPICVPSCTTNANCRSDLFCRELPLLTTGAHDGGAYSFGSACFADTPGEVGESCIGGNEQPDPSECALGLCVTLGLRDLCTAPCNTSSDCPSSAACAIWMGPSPPAPPTPLCLARCDATQPCLDPLLECLSAGTSGALGFSLPDDAGTTVCAPRVCTGASDCPGGQCVMLGSTSFCTR
jgi:hypothetical protein